MKSVVRITNGYQQSFKEHLHSVEKFCGEFSESYAKEYYPNIKGAILEYLENDDHLTSPSQETKLCFGQCIQHGFAEELYTDLLQTVNLHLNDHSQCLCDRLSLIDDELKKSCTHIRQFHNKLKSFGQFIQMVSPIFRQLNSSYVQPKLHCTIEEKLLELFKQLFVEKHASSVIRCMWIVRKSPFSLPPSIMYEVANALYSMQPNIRPEHEDLFSLYIPNARAPLKYEELEREKQTIRKMQIDIQREMCDLGFPQNKRSNNDVQIEDEECPHSMLSSLLMGLGT